MIVLKAKVSGFCMGVRRAVDLAFEEARKASENNTPIYTIGPLIHNPKVLDDLKAAGIQIIDENSIYANNDNANNEPITDNCSLFSVPCSLIIRAHGISCILENQLRNIGCRIVDATCPKVKANQLKIRELIKDGYFIFLAGEANHAEIEGLLGYTHAESDAQSITNCVIVGNAEEARKKAEKLFNQQPRPEERGMLFLKGICIRGLIPFKRPKARTRKRAEGIKPLSTNKSKSIKTALLSQTTISGGEYKTIGDEIKKYFPDLKIVNTICDATSERQQALREILPQVDAVIIAGGEESANTRRLLAIAEGSGKPCVLAEDAKGIPEQFYKFEKIGISAGASTPDVVVEGIVMTLKTD